MRYISGNDEAFVSLDWQRMEHLHSLGLLEPLVRNFLTLLGNKVQLKLHRKNYFLDPLCPLGDLLGGSTFAGADFADGAV